MKKYLLAFLIVLTPQLCHADITTGLVARYTMDGNNIAWTSATAGTVRDIAGGFTGTLTNLKQATSTVTGVIGQAIQFARLGSYISTTYNTGYTNTSTFTFSAWIRTKDADRGIILGNYAGSSDNRATNFEVAASGQLRAYINDNTNVKDYLATTPLVNTGAWVHVAETYNGAQGLKLFINGAETALTKTSDGTLSGSINSGSTMRMGIDNRSTPGVLYLDGSISDVRIYNRALSTSDIRELYNYGRVRIQPSLGKTIISRASKLLVSDGLISYYTMNGSHVRWTSASAGTLTDLASSTNTGTLKNFKQATSTKPGKVGQALDFGGVSENVSTGSDFIGAGAFSFCGRFNARAVVGNTILFSNGRTTMQYSTNNRVTFTSNNSTTLFSSNNAIIAGRWQSVCVARNAVGTTTMYVNGYVTGAANTSTGTPVAGTANVSIGQSTVGTGRYNGLMDELRMWNRELSANEVYLISNGGQATLDK